MKISKVPFRKPPRGNFDLSHEFKFTCDMGKLIPFLCQEVVPGDTFKFGNNSIAKLMPLVAPVMHNVDVYTRYFFVPNRLLWDNWENFITGGKDNSWSGHVPLAGLVSPRKGSLADYLGVPVTDQSLKVMAVSALPFRAYNLIYNEYFINHNIQSPVGFSTGDDFLNTENKDLLNVNWEKDYFTSALTSPQAGSGASIPVGSLDISANIPANTLNLSGGSHTHSMSGVVSNDPFVTATGNKRVGLYSNPSLVVSGGNLASTRGVYSDGSGSVVANVGLNLDLSNTSVGNSSVGNITNPEDVDLPVSGDINPVSVEALRNAFKVQGFLEKLARGGWKYVDWLLSFFGVKASDARLQRPEYIGGSKSPLFFSEVLQTSSTDNTSPQGNMSGKGSGVSSSKMFKKYFEEHGFLIGLYYIKPRANYMQGLNRMWRRLNKFDYLIPEFASLGEQAILNEEIYYDFNTPTNNELTFGYQSRYQEYRSAENRVAGEFHDTLKYWTLAREFNGMPLLNGNFLKCDPSTRIYATSGSQYSNRIMVDLANIIYANRPLPKYVEPASLN